MSEQTKAPKERKTPVLISHVQTGVHFGCRGIVRRAKDRRIIYASDIIRPYGFTSRARDDAKSWAVEHGYYDIEEDKR